MSNAWKCELCGYVQNGDAPPGFCPVCGADRTSFSPLTLSPPNADTRRATAWQCSICDHVTKDSVPPEFCPVCGAAAALFHPFSAAEPPPVAADVDRVVILGAGIAGLTAAEEARRRAADVEITLISKEMTLPYYRLNLTRFLAGEVSEGDLFIQHQEWFASQRIEYLAGEALAIDRVGRLVRLKNGRSLAYDRLVLANGAHPFIPPLPGVNRAGVTTLRTLENARRLIGELHPGCRVVCVGGGLLGLESAWALQKRGAAVTVLEGFDWLLPRQLPKRAGILLQTHLQTRGMTIACGVQVKEFTGDETVRGVLLEDGRELPADLVVLATGVRPNSHLARQCGLKVNQGVVVDDRLVTSDPQILAAGDVAEHQGKVYGIWPASYAQGVIAGTNAVGAETEFNALPMTNRIKVLDIDLFSIGQIQATDASTRLVEMTGGNHYRGLACRDGRAVGAALYGDMALMGLLQDAVEGNRPIPELTSLQAHFPELQNAGG